MDVMIVFRVIYIVAAFSMFLFMFAALVGLARIGLAVLFNEPLEPMLRLQAFFIIELLACLFTALACEHLGGFRAENIGRRKRP